MLTLVLDLLTLVLLVIVLMVAGAVLLWALVRLLEYWGII